MIRELFIILPFRMYYKVTTPKIYKCVAVVICITVYSTTFYYILFLHAYSIIIWSVDSSLKNENIFELSFTPNFRIKEFAMIRINIVRPNGLFDDACTLYNAKRIYIYI